MDVEIVTERGVINMAIRCARLVQLANSSSLDLVLFDPDIALVKLDQLVRRVFMC